MMRLPIWCGWSGGTPSPFRVMHDVRARDDSGPRVDAGAREARALRVRLGRVIQALRRAGGFASQDAFADAVGVHRAYAGKLERGEVNLTLDTLGRVARTLGVTPGQLLIEAEGESGAPPAAESRPTLPSR